MGGQLWIKDPIHGSIVFDGDGLSLFTRLLNSAALQRLRRIKQLGNLHLVYPSATHTRFTHSLGTYQTVKKILSHLRGKIPAIDGLEDISVLCAALLHDIGHGPLSHDFEMISVFSHEELTRMILCGDDEISSALCEYSLELPERVLSVLSHRSENRIIRDLVSSQLDADRLDYLCRDSYMTGVKVGNLDIDRIISIIDIHDGQLVILEKGIGTIEQYILARYFMYKEVYLHKVGIGASMMLRKIFDRIKDLSPVPSLLEEALEPWRPFLFPASPGTKESDIVSALRWLDDTSLLYLLRLCLRCGDPVLRLLAGSYLRRRLFKALAVPADISEQDIGRAGNAAGVDIRYFYALYPGADIEDAMDPPIRIYRNETAAVFSLPECSPLLRQFFGLHLGQRKSMLFVYPEYSDIIRGHLSG